MVLRPCQIYENVYDYLYGTWLNSLIYIYEWKHLSAQQNVKDEKEANANGLWKQLVENHENELTAI